MKSKIQVLVTDRFDVEAEARLRTTPGLSVSRSAAPLPTDAELAQCQILIVRSRTFVDSPLLARAPHLKAVITSTSGFDHIDLGATRARGLVVMYTPDANAASAAELTWALVLAAVRRLPAAHRAVKAGEWRREALMGHELNGRTFGVIGLGRIGSRVARIAEAFGMRVVAFDPYKDDEHFAKHRATRLGLDELFKEADVVSCHVPATPETDHMITPFHFSESGRELVFVNTSRGQVVAESVLLEALDKGWLASCGLDVFEREPLPRSSNLTKHPHVVLTPHIGATTHEAFRAASIDAADKAIAFALKSESRDRLPPEEAWVTGGFKRTSAD